MPLPKDPVKCVEFKRTQKLHALLLVALGVYNNNEKRKGIPVPADILERRTAILKQVFNTAEAKEKRRQQGRACRNISKWYVKLSPEAKKKLHTKATDSTHKLRKGKTYAEIYGQERALVEAKNREDSNKKRWDIIGRKLQDRPHQGCGEKCTEWRKAVFGKDDYICQMCGKRGSDLHAHHIKPWAQFIDLRYEISNGMTLCASPCHKDIHKRIRLVALFLEQLARFQGVAA